MTSSTSGIADLVPSSRTRRPSGVVGRTLALAAAALTTAALLVWTPAIASGFNRSSAEATLWQLLNGARVNNGRAPLQQHSTLVGLARWRSQDLIDRNYFSHDVLGTGYQVYHWYDTNGLNYSWGGENIGWNSGYADGDSPIAIHEGFMASPGHRANVLEPSFTHGGVGAYAADNVNYLGKMRSPRMYTELFMVAASAPPPPPPEPQPTAPPSSGGTTRHAAPAAPAAPQPRSKPRPNLFRVDRPAAPKASLKGREAVLVAAELEASAPEHAAPVAAPGEIVSYRVEAATAPDRGIFETLLGTVLSFFI